MTKEEMEEAVSEARELVALAEQGALLPDLAPEERKGSEALLRRILTKREAWLRRRNYPSVGSR
jgi:AMMECR1 domain-containing protein